MSIIVNQSQNSTLNGSGLTFLGLVQRACVEAGSSGNGPSTTANQKGEYGRFVNWVNDAWLDIQSKHQDWGWLRVSPGVSFVPTSLQFTTTPAVAGAVNFGMWARDTFRNYATVQGQKSEVTMAYLDYDLWRDTYQIGALRNSPTRPIEVAISPVDKSICLGPAPDGTFTVTADYFRAPSYMINDNDIPLLPAQFHMAIVWAALVMYGEFEAAPDVIQRGQTKLLSFMRKMERDRLPELTTCAALT